MNKINLEIIEYIKNVDFDENLKQFFIAAIIFELRNMDSNRFTASYESMIENAIEFDEEL